MRLFRSIVAAAVIVSGMASLAYAQENTMPSEIKGFRSARFGMDEARVREAMVKDLGITAGAIERSVSPTEKTTVLMATVENLLPDAGPATIAYILGYSSQKLTVINIVWSKSSDPNLISTAVALRDYFQKWNIPKDKVVINAELPNGDALVFRGTDTKDSLVSLIFHASPKPQKAGDAPKQEGALRLSYVEAPDKLDVFTLKPGQF
ncbi:MAG: hypothetical protein HY985_13760 [Magnetospirillum sp.]|nr:hypothetical protein [Magnetospirillum sp.]